MIVTVAVSLILFIPSSYGGNILAILPTPSYSHQVAYTHIWKELSLRGHKVTVLTTDPLNDPKLTNLTEIDLKWTYNYLGPFTNVVKTEITMWDIHQAIYDLGSVVSRLQLSHPEVQSLINNKSRFDVVLTEFIYPEFLAFAEISSCPKIIFSSLDPSATWHNLMGNPTTPAVYPEMGSTFYGPLNFGERIISTLYTWYTLYFYHYKTFADRNELVKKHFNVSKTVYELVSDVDLMFTSVSPILQPIRALGPSTIMVGGKREEVSPKPLPQDIAEFLDSAVDGFVYFSLGSNVKSKDLQEETQKAILGGLRELPYKVLWKYEADELPNKPDNVKLIKWAPQQTVLAHPNIKVFVTQGGLQSMEEAFYSGVPYVVIPWFGDQYYNARLLESKGVAIVVNRKPSVNKLELKNAILEVIRNPKYRDTVRKLRDLALDSPMTGLERAVWWTEYVIRNKGAKHLRNPAADIPFYQYYLIDVISFLMILIVVTFTSMYFIFRLSCKYVKLLSFKNSSDSSCKKKSE